MMRSGTHIMKRFVTINGGNKLAGHHFPLVMDEGKPTKAQHIDIFYKHDKN